jgi:hypothetical protein
MPTSKNPWLKAPILDYIRANDGKVDSVDIWRHFKLTPDITLPEVHALEDEGKIRKLTWGNRHVYEVV